MKEMKQDSSTIAWNAMGDEWFELAQTGEARNCFINVLLVRVYREGSNEKYKNNSSDPDR